tara:strand:+ start:896 stop:1090 length:195 start_codon:yes stop_codon:yes gene_type:complete
MEGEGMPVKSEAADPAEEVSPAEKAKAEAATMTNHLKPLSALKKGNLYIRFDIIFPSINTESKQ